MTSGLYSGLFYSIDQYLPLASGNSHGPGDFSYTVYDLCRIRLNSNSEYQALTITALKDCHVKGTVATGGSVPTKSVDTDLLSGNSLYYQGQYSSVYGYYLEMFNIVVY